MLDALYDSVPYRGEESLRMVVVGGSDAVAQGLLARFPASTLARIVADDAAREASVRALAADRVKVRSGAVDALDWWDAMFGADLVVVVEALHTLNAAKTQYLYKAAADRLSARGALLVADRLPDQASALLHQLIWLRHAGFAAVECTWLVDRQAVFGGFKSAMGT